MIPTWPHLGEVLISLAGTVDGDALLNALAQATTQEELNALLADVLPDEGFAPTLNQVQIALATFNLVWYQNVWRYRVLVDKATVYSRQISSLVPATAKPGPKPLALS